MHRYDQNQGGRRDEQNRRDDRRDEQGRGRTGGYGRGDDRGQSDHGFMSRDHYEHGQGSGAENQGQGQRPSYEMDRSRGWAAERDEGRFRGGDQDSMQNNRDWEERGQWTRGENDRDRWRSGDDRGRMGGQRDFGAGSFRWDQSHASSGYGQGNVSMGAGGRHYGEPGSGTTGWDMGNRGAQDGHRGGQRSQADEDRMRRDHMNAQGSGGYGTMGRGAGAQRSENYGKAPKGYTRSDDRIKEEVCDCLSDADVDASEIEVEVQGGTVRLSGTVKNKTDKRTAEDIAEECRGVKSVENNIRVQSQSQSASSSKTNGNETQDAKKASDSRKHGIA